MDGRLGDKSAERKSSSEALFLCRGYPSRAQGKKPRPTKLPNMLRLGFAGSGQEAATHKAGEGARKGYRICWAALC
jgi:hypothetical protein